MAPTIYRVGRYRFFINSREETRLHVHVATSDGLAKFWLEPIIALAGFHNVQAADLREMERLVKEHEDEFKSAWSRHFSQ